MSKKPNIILIGIDSLRADHMGVYGYKHNNTPHIAEFAKGGDALRAELQPAHSDHERLREHAHRHGLLPHPGRRPSPQR